MSNITNEITLLFKTRLDEKSKTEIGKNLKGLLENAVITFDEAEIKKSLQPIVQMMKTMFDKAGMAFDADKLLGMPSKQALQSMANLSIKDLQTAYDKAVANSGGVKIDFGNMDLSALSSTLNGIAADVEAVNQKMANSTKKSTSEIEASINRLKPSTKVMVDGVEQAGGKLEKTVSHIEKTLERVNKPSHMYNENSATKALETAREKYINSVTKNDPWEVQYQHMLSFVSKYEAMSQKIKPIIDTNRPEFKNLYDTLAPKAGAAKISLEHFVDIVRGNEFSEYKNQPWARESTLKNIEQVLRSGISVKGRTNDGPNNSELNNNKTDSPSKTIDDNQKSKTVPDKSTSAAVNKVKKEATPDTSAFNQELFNAIEKFSNVVEKAFKSMRSGKIDEDTLDDQRAAAIQQLLNKFKFNNPQRVDDYLYEKSDDMGAWDSKKIYNKLSQQLSSKDPSWTKIQNKDVATRQNNTAAITSETEAQENLNKVEAQNPPAKDESSVHNANTNAIEKEAQTQEKLNNNKIQEPTSKDDVSQINVETEALQKQAQIQNDINTSKTNEQPAVNDTPQIQNENTVLDEQNAKLKENITLKGQTKDVGTGGTKTTSDVVTYIQPVPAGTVSAEATELESVRVKIEEVVTAINTKTAAFTAESTEVQRVVGVENVALNSLKENIETITTAVKNKTQAFTAEGAEVQRVVDTEINALNNLEQKKINSSAGNNAPLESVQTQPISVASTEVVELEAIKTKLIEVTSAVNTKTQAFLAEQKAVKSVAQSEVNAMGQVGKSVTAVRVALNNLQTKQHKINLTVAGGEDVANISATETQALTKLRAALQLTTKRVNEKTQAFNNEKTVVNKAVNSEINALNRLNTRVGEINKTISNLLQNLQSVKAASGNVKIPTPTPPKETQSVKDDSSADISSTTQKAEPTKADLNSLTKQYEQLGRLQAQFRATGNLKTEQEINSLQRTIELEKNRLGLTREQITALESKRNLANADEQEAIEAEIREKNRLHYAKEEEKARKEAFKSEKQNAQREAMLGKANSAVNRAENTWMGAVGIEGNLSSSFTAEVDSYYQKLDALRRKHEELKSSKLISPEQQKELINQIVKINKMTAEIGELVAEYQKLSGSNVNPENIRATALLPSDSMDMYKQQLTNYVREITNGQGQIKNFDATTRTLTYTVQTGAHEFTEYTAAVRRADNSLVSVQGTTKRTETFLEATKRKMKEISSYMSGMMLFYRAMSVFRQGLQYIKEIDTALTELKKVTDETEETYSKFLDTAAETAEKVGSTIQKVISSTADWARLGYSMKEAAKFAESTQILMNVSEFTDVSQATDALISAVQAFEYTAETSMNVVDLLNTIGNNYAISTADLAQSLTKSSASLVAAGGDLAEAAALTATANAIIQDADAVGTALKTTSLRLRGTSVDVLEEEGIDSDGAVTSKSKLQSKVKAISGVDILTETGEYKSTYQILSQIADVWEDINDIDQAALLEMLAGKRNASVLAAILQAPEELKAAYEDANNASGSALKENEKYLDSIQGRMDVFANSVQTMWNNVIGSDAVKWFVTLGTTIIQVIDKVGLLNTALIALGAFKGGKFLLNVLSGMGFSFKDLTARLSQYLIGVNAATVATHQLTQAQLLQKLKLTGLTDEMAAAVVAETGLGVSTKTLSAEQLKAALIAKGYSEELADETVQKVLATATTSKLTFTESLAHTQLVKTLATRALVRAAQKQGITLTEAEIAAKLKDMTANQMLSMSFKELGVSMLNVGKKILPLIAAIAAIAAVVWVVDELTTTTEEAKEAFDEFNSVLSETESQLDELESQLSDINSQIEELNSQGALTFTDREELQRLKAQSNEIQRQIDLTENLKKQQQTQVNGAALTMADMYEDVGMTTGKTTEELKSTGGTGGAIIGGAGLGIAGAMGVGASIGIAGGPVGLIVGAVVGAIVGAIIGVAGGAAVGAAEEKVGDSLDNMKKQYEKLQSEYNAARANYQKDASEDNKEKFEEAQEAFNSYQSNMANYMTEMNSYYSQIKANWDVATEEQKQAYNEWADTMDTWAIQTGGQNAKSNALDRLFGENAEGGFAIARDRVDEIKEKLKDAQETGDELAITNALKELEDFKLEGILSEEEVERLRNLGLYLYEAEDRFKDVVKTESEFINNDLEDVAKDINKIAEGLESLKSAFEEVLEEEVLTAKTLKSLKEELKIESSYSDIEEVQDAWRNYLDIMMSGAATTEEMTKVTEQLAQAILDAALAKNDLKPETKYEYVAQLRQLGVANAEEYVDDLLQKNMVQEIERSAEVAEDAVRKAYTESTKNILGPVKSFDELDDTEIRELAKQYGLLGDISNDVKQDIMERYGVEEDAVDAIIEKLKEKQDLEKQIAAKQKEKSDYEAWRNGDGTNKGILALQEELQQIGNLDDYKAQTRWVEGVRGGGHSETYYQSADGKYLSEDDYNKYKKIKEQYDALWAEGEEKGYIIDGKIVNPDFQAEIDGLQNQIDGITKDIDENITIDIDLKLKLQDKSELVDDIQNTFDTLVNAQKEYDENGYITTDTLQTLLQLEPKYLDLLVDEEGKLNLTKDALYNVGRARVADMAIQQKKNILEKANQLAAKGSSDALREHITVMENANAMGDDFVANQMKQISVLLDKQIAEGKLNEFEKNEFLNGVQSQLDAVDQSTQIVLDNFENAFSSAGNTAKQEAEDAFKKAMEYWENRIGANQSLYEQLQNDIDLLEKKGQIAGESYYQAQIDVEKEHLKHLKDQRDEATKFLKDETPGTERWWEIANTLNDIEGEIDSVTLSIQDLSDAMAQVHWDVFDQAHERMDDLTTQLSNVREILSADEDSFFTDEGEWSDTGIAVLATHIQDIAVAESTLADVEKELKNLKMSDFDSENEYYDKLIELTEKQQDYTMAISDSEQAVVDMYESNIDAVEEYFDKLIENYSDYIDSVKEALDAERDLYDFKKNVQKQSKDIAEIERRIASLSGSTNASDVAERRKLEAELYESRESLNDTYYDHAKQSQQDALDAEQTAYEETLTKMVEGMRISLEEATTNMQAFLDSVTIAVSMNADTVLNKYQSTELYLSPALTNPWEAAKKAVGEYGGDANNLMDVWAKDGYFAKFSSEAGTNLKSPFNAGKTAADEFGKSVGSAMTNVYTNIQSNVQKSVTELDKIKQKYKEINDEVSRPPSGAGINNGNGGGQILAPRTDVYQLQQMINGLFSSQVGTLGVNGIYDAATKSAVARIQEKLGITPTGLYDEKTKQAMQAWLNKQNVGSWFKKVGFGIPAAMYAKGTTGTTRDQWAITDEPQFGDELVLVPGKDGNLSFMRKGTGVVPADMTQKIFELAQIPTSDLMNKNLTAIVPNITKNDFKNEFNFESLVHVDTVDSDTLPKLEKMVDKKIDDFSKALNYSIKRFAR